MLACIGILLSLGRWLSIFSPNFVVINAEIHSHISNFSLSMLFYLYAGFVWLLSGVKFRYIICLGIFIIISNFLCETLMGFMNTADIIDAVYGTAGTLIVLIYLSFANHFGLIPVDSVQR